MLVNAVILFAYVYELPWGNLEIRIKRTVAFVTLVYLVKVSGVYCLGRFEHLLISLSIRGIFSKAFVKYFQVIYVRFGVSG